MCGIVGTFNFSGRSGPVDVALLVKMRDSLSHRGPDGAGIWVSQNGCVGLGHRRLSIIDLSHAASQPMSNEDGSVQLVFNGEIYNHAEIRSELEKLGGHKWRTDHSDTEVIIHAFEEWGIECLHRFRGMFAIAIWDDNREELWLIRDRLGVKPLYYSARASSLAFASEIKALLVDPTQARSVDEESLFHYLSFLTTPAPKTLFSGIYKVPNGCWVQVDRQGAVRQQRYWDVWDNVQPLTDSDEADIAARVLDELRASVKLRKISDVPVGVFLSGGIDSSTNAILFSEDEQSQVKTFSIGYDQEYGSYKCEFPYARMIAKLVNSSHHERTISVSDLISFLPEMVYLQDEALGDPVSVPVYYLARLARESGVIVAQCGEGADELFVGYPHWKRILRAQRRAQMIPSAFRGTGMRVLKEMGKESSIYYEWLRREQSGSPLFWGGAEGFLEGHKQRLLSDRLRKQFRGLTSWDALEPVWKRFKEAAWDRSPVNWMGYLDINLRLPELLLMRLDKMTMGVGLEGRVPFLDHKFVELAFSIPAALRFKRGELKYLLKRAVQPLLPAEILARPKQGFGVPIHEWMLGALGESARKTVEEFCNNTDFFNPAAVRLFLQQESPEYRWYLLNLALWWKQHIA